MENDTVGLYWILLTYGFPIALLAFAYLTGRYLERQHYESIFQREKQTLQFPAVTFEAMPGDWQRAMLVRGSVVISLDHFKRFLAALRGLVGGEVKSYGSLLDRARREAVLRMKEQAIASGCDGVINVRLETSRLASSRGDGKGCAGIELMAFGTGVKRA